MLTLTALICRSLGWYPLWLMLFSLGSTDVILPASGVLFVTALLSTGCQRMLRQRLYTRKKLALCLSVLLTLLSAAAGTAGCVLLGSGIFISIFASAVTVICTHRNPECSTDALFSLNAYTAFLSGTVISTVLLRLTHQPTFLTQTLAVAGFISALYFLLRNQLMLRRYINRRSAADTDVPQDIRRSNLSMVCGIILLFAVVFLFHEPLVRLLLRMQSVLVSLFFGLCRAFFRLIDRLSGEAPSETFDETAEDISQELASGSANPLWLLFWIPFIAVAIFIWREFLSDWVYDIRMLLQSLIARLRNTDRTDAEIRRTDTDEYYDTETTLRRDKKQSSRKKAWRRALRKWQAMPDSNAKFYAGYRLLLDAPCWTDGMLQVSDTVREIRNKWADCFSPQEALDAATSDFHADRYAETGLPAEAIADLNKALSCIRNTEQPDRAQNNHGGIQ